MADRSGAALLMFGTLFTGWLYVTGRLQRVIQAVNGEPAPVPDAPPEVLGGMIGGGMAELRRGGGLPPAVPGGVTPGTLPIPTIPPGGGGLSQARTVTVGGPRGSITLIVTPADCRLHLYGAALGMGLSETDARKAAEFQCGALWP